MKRSLNKSSKHNSENLLTELKNQQEFNMLNTKKLLETSKKAFAFSKFVIFLSIIVIGYFVFMSKVYLDIMIMLLNELEVIKKFLLRK